MASLRDMNWVIQIGQRFLKHPRGEMTKLRDEAYGYHYQYDALREADGWQSKDIERNISVLRRKDAPVELPVKPAATL
jgi:hypothetical protein